MLCILSTVEFPLARADKLIGNTLQKRMIVAILKSFTPSWVYIKIWPFGYFYVANSSEKVQPPPKKNTNNKYKL